MAGQAGETPHGSPVPSTGAAEIGGASQRGIDLGGAAECQRWVSAFGPDLALHEQNSREKQRQAATVLLTRYGLLPMHWRHVRRGRGGARRKFFPGLRPLLTVRMGLAQQSRRLFCHPVPPPAQAIGQDEPESLHQDPDVTPDF
ncbi:hypothetical protein MAPG_03550 [Magnaporthiopsis poae ATCC 64411]|uniref:Uncharacterized protein n=1 Tax=Magnaporthiopsis poae (strain ATCC 64411 / 73-15) TaxID=644358 RepID=A0A0C4DUB3_MAGP6|nr:hypothetical protein MAPG_03550 [Magnaporthiopsis poae ATCC 64411]